MPLCYDVNNGIYSSAKTIKNKIKYFILQTCIIFIQWANKISLYLEITPMFSKICAIFKLLT